MRQRDLVWIRFPSSNLKQAKARPAIVVSNDAYNEAHGDVVICAVTSNLSPAAYKVPLSSKDLEAGDLPLDSMVRADKVIQVEQDLVERSFGTVGDQTYDAIVEAVHALLRRGGGDAPAG